MRRREGEEETYVRVYQGKKCGAPRQAGDSEVTRKSRFFRLLSDGRSGGFSVQEPRDHREKEKSKKVLLYPRAPLKIKCFCNEFDLTIVESNQGRDAVQSPGEDPVLASFRSTVTVTAAVGTNKHKHVSGQGAEADSSSTVHCQCTRPTPFHLPH